jgi:hypothetical protein
MRKDFSSNLCVQTGSEAHPASYPVGTGGPFPGAKARPGRDGDHSPHLVPRSRMSRSYTPLPQAPSWRVVGQLYLFFYRKKFWIGLYSLRLGFNYRNEVLMNPLSNVQLGVQRDVELMRPTSSLIRLQILLCEIFFKLR